MIAKFISHRDDLSEVTMEYSIVGVLHDWMHKKRITKAVAQQMGKNENTFYAEISQRPNGAKLGADDLVPLFNAIRAIGYGDELRGILKRFISELKGLDLQKIPDSELIPRVLHMQIGLATFLECAARIPSIMDTEELLTVRRLLNTEIVPVLMKMDYTIELRLTYLQKIQGGQFPAPETP
ncbi:MAG: hypothetical protein ACOZB3_00155 [Calditrichota bacterium]